MAKTIKQLLAHFLTNRVDKEQAKIDFLKVYQELQIQSQTQKMHSLNDKNALRFEKDIQIEAILAGIKHEFIEAEKQAAIDQVTKRFYWKKRAVKQTAKRNLAKHPAEGDKWNQWMEAKLAKIHSQETLILNQVTADYLPSESDAELAKANYQRRFSEAKIRQEERDLAVQLKLAKRKEKIESQVTKKIANATKRINNHQAKIELLLKNMAKVDSDVPDDVLLRLQNLTMRFGGLVAVDQLSFDVKQGEIFGLIGPNGAGKTTVFNCITKFYRPASGAMYFRKNPVEVIDLNMYPVHKIIKQGIVRTFQNVELIWELSVIDNLLVAAHSLFQTGFFGHMLHTPKLRQEEAVLRKKGMDVLQQLGLAPYAEMIPFGLPYGILKKIELARTLMANPKLIILDEPAAGLNDAETLDLARIIKSIRDEYQATIFLVEHDMGLVMNVCDTVCAISFGKKLAIGTPSEIQANKVVRDAYLGEE